MSQDDAIAALARQLIMRATERGIMLATAESCTGGLVAGAITAIAGSSAVFDRGFVTYSNDAKTTMLGVGVDTLEAFGAVSAETAREMAVGALTRSNAGVAASVTGIAGPGGGSAEKPVGLVYICVAALKRQPQVEEYRFADTGREGIRQITVVETLRAMIAALPEE